MSENLVQLSRRFADLRGGLEAIKNARCSKPSVTARRQTFSSQPLRPGLRGRLSQRLHAVAREIEAKILEVIKAQPAIRTADIARATDRTQHDGATDPPWPSRR